MGLFNNRDVVNEQMADMQINNINELAEAMILDELYFLTDEQKEEFAMSEACQELINEGLLKRQSVVRLTKNDDLTRRTKLAAFQLAKERNDPLWGLLVKNRVKERALIGQIVKKYQSPAQRNARLTQKNYLHSGKLPAMLSRPIKMG